MGAECRLRVKYREQAKGKMHTADHRSLSKYCVIIFHYQELAIKRIIRANYNECHSG